MYHYLEQESPEAARKMREFVVDHYVKEGRYENLAQQYAAQGLERDIDGELTADNLFDVMAQEGFLKQYAAEDAKTVKTLRNTIAAFIRHINTALQKLTRTNPIHREIYESLTEDKKSLEKLRRMFNDALDELNADNKPAAKRSEENQSSEMVKYSKKTDDSIKEQLKANRETLNIMNPVAVINEHPDFKSGADVQKWALSRFKQIGFEIHRQGFGRVVLDKKRVQSSLRYFGTYEERVALLAVPKVIKQGKIIADHKNHKGREYDTVTFAAPVIVNDVRGNMAVVARIESGSKSYYKVHRIIMPDGAEFSFENRNRDIAERAPGKKDSSLSPTDNISTNSIPRGQSESQDKLSLKTPVEETKDLVAVHNFKTEDLQGAENLGGLAMPSIAVIKAKQGHNEFGAISLVFRRKTVDPVADRRNNIYSGDAYTPTFPIVTYKANAEKKEKLEDLYYKYKKDSENDEMWPLYRYSVDIESRLNRAGGEKALIRELYNDEGMMKVYRLIHEVQAKNEIDPKTYRKWIDDLFVGIEEKAGIRNKKELFTPSGNRRSWDVLHDVLSLESVVKNMREQDAQGNGAFGKSIFGASTIKYRSIEDLKKETGRLNVESADVIKQKRKEIIGKFYDLAHQISSEGAKDAGDVLCEAIEKYKTKDAIRRYVREQVAGWGHYSDEIVDDFIALVQDIRSMPTEYFEAKPARAVGFDEIAYAVIPLSDSRAASILDRLRVDYVTYADGNDEDRTRVLNEKADELGDIKFSLKPASSIDEENRRLIEQNETYKAVIGKLNRQITALQKKVVDPKGVRKLARDVRAEYQSKIPQAEPEPNMFVQNAKKTDEIRAVFLFVVFCKKS